MISRRLVVAAAAAFAFTATAASAQDWKVKYPELVMALVPAENATGVLARVGPFAEYLTGELGVKVSVPVPLFTSAAVPPSAPAPPKV